MKYIMIYTIESSICLIIFMAFYNLVLRKDTHHEINRAFLLFSLFASFIFPLLEVDLINPATSVNNNIIGIILPSITIHSNEAGVARKSFSDILLAIYITGALISTAFFLTSCARLILLILKNKPSEGIIIRFDDNKPSCFSAFGFIFISKSVSGPDSERMISHEMNHINKYHFIDLLIIAIAGIVQWFNPAVYFLRRSLQAVHEFEADQECLLNGEEIEDYRSLLVSAAFATSLPILTNKFSNTSLLKKRIAMMTKKKTWSLAPIKILFAVPLAILMFFAFSCKKSTTAKDNAISLAQQTASDVVYDTAKVKTTDETVFIVCEQMPVFPGGDSLLFKNIYSNIKYPDAAKENGIEGKVIVKFIIDEEGNVKNPVITRSASPLLDKAAIDAIKSLSKFEPGMQGGKPVRVYFSLPINFKLK